MRMRLKAIMASVPLGGDEEFELGRWRTHFNSTEIWSTSDTKPELSGSGRAPVSDDPDVINLPTCQSAGTS